MKIRILDRILVALAGLLMLAGCAAAAAQLFFGKDVAAAAANILNNANLRIWLIIAMILFTLLGIYCILLLFRHRGRNEKFIMQKTENGELSISLKAMESMVQKCLDPHKELTVQAVQLENQKGGLLIRIRGTVAGGVSIPLTVDALQQQIKQYVTACSGVEVKDICVLIESSGPDAEGAVFAIEPPTSKALPASQAAKEELAEEPEKDKAAEEINADEIEKVLAEIPAPKASDSEDDTAQVVVPAAAAAVAEMLKNEAPEEEDDRPMHQRLFSNPEEPCVMPMPPEATEPETEKTAEPEKAAEPEKTEPEKTEEEKTEDSKPETPAKEDEQAEATAEKEKDAAEVPEETEIKD